ncbi:hypothetical protein [Muriicola sp. Z0-33]|uniref:hypothetical protein n=1 Tax=Muriicola sp. Z0-33 TaxID=2816957 RepID=UPI002238EF34|nr:hypothetical protein [Muriicola sp. Z0-33]MCW5517120.1 hypothetical protein [Muriicola sp. Z0-33]
MKLRIRLLLVITFAFITVGNSFMIPDHSPQEGFNVEKDLLLVQYDCKTDVDDLHSVAAFITLMSHPDYAKVSYHAVAGTYGVQEGLYVPPNSLFQMAFGKNWTDAHNKLSAAVKDVKAKVKKTLDNDGNIWIAEAGQSDFTAALIAAVKEDMPDINSPKRFHVVQHSNWNEEVTDQQKLAYVKSNATYHKIPDGNAVGNGTPGFRTPEYSQWKTDISEPALKELWQHAVQIGNKYNGVEGRYNNEAIAAGGLDFSDTSEVCWILGLQDIKDTAEFFSLYAK